MRNTSLRLMTCSDPISSSREISSERQNNLITFKDFTSQSEKNILKLLSIAGKFASTALKKEVERTSGEHART
jgi:hypothetical protein